MSKIKRRSGIAVVNICGLLDWRPDVIYQVGVGVNHGEIDHMWESWPGVRFIGCEAHPGIVKSIEKSYPGELYEVAIGAERGKTKLYTKSRHKDGSSLYPHRNQHEHEGYHELGDVLMSTLDSMFASPMWKKWHVQNLPKILLWLDCEGSELDALRGGAEFLKSVQVVNVEMTSNPPGVGWADPIEVHQLLIASGFLRQSVHTNRSSSGQADCVYVRRELFKPEYCCCPCQITTNRLDMIIEFLESMRAVESYPKNENVDWIINVAKYGIEQAHEMENQCP